MLALPLAFIGVIVEYVAWTVGLGATALDRFPTADGPRANRLSFVPRLRSGLGPAWRARPGG